MVVVEVDEVLTLERLEAEIVSMAADLAAAEAQWIIWIAEYDRRKGWESWGCRSCAHWLSWKCGLSLHAAQERLRTGHALVELPAITEAFVAGKLSYSKVRALTRVADVATEETLLGWALCMTAAQVDKLAAACRRTGSDDEAADAMARRSVSRVRLGNGITRIIIDEPDDAADVVWAGIEDRVEELIDDAIADSGRSRREVVDERGGIAAVRADALVDIAARARQMSPADADRNRDRGPGHLHLTLEADADQPEGTEPLVTLNGWALTNPVARRWLCDINGSVMIEDRAGVPVAEGSLQRIVPRAMRRRLSRRDDHQCRFPHCDASYNLHAHHIQHWIHGGATELENLVMLCPFHHRLVHEGGWTIEVTADGELDFIAPRGEQITNSAPPATDPGAIPRRHRRNGHKPELIDRWDGTRPRYGELVGLVTQISSRVDRP